MRSINWELKKAIAESPFKVCEAEEEAGLPKTKLSRISSGLDEPSWDEKERIAEVLKKSVDEIFRKGVGV